MEKKSSIIKQNIIAIAAVAVCVLLDQFTKSLAVIHLKGQNPLVLIQNIFELLYLENQGAAFGIMQNMQIFFTIGAVVIICVILYFWRKLPSTRHYLPLRICGVLLCAGAIGNMIDRICNNYVVDFFYFKLIDFPVFNVADIYVTVACFLFAYLILFYYKEEDLI